METKYYTDKGKTITAYIWYRLLDAKNKIIRDYPDAACYAGISYGTIDKNTKVIDVYRNRDRVPYNQDEVIRFVYDLNEMGFPITLVNDDKAVYHFHLYTDEYKSKLHIMSALTILRVLWEQGLNKIPDFYFQLMDKNPDADKLDKLQEAHKTKGSNANAGHCITFPGNGANIDKDTLFERFNKGSVFDGGVAGICNAWKGLDPYPMHLGCADCLYKRQHNIYP